ncbi:unnamed protein product, partial [marine sediment metagenome]
MKVDDKLLKKSLNAAIDFSVIKKDGFKDKVRKFDESIDFIINLKDINLNDPKQRIDKEILLPNNIITGEKPNVCVIASDEILMEAKNLGLETIDSDGLVKLNNEEKKVKKKFVKKYDFFIVEDKSFLKTDADEDIVSGFLTAFHHFSMEEFHQSLESIEMGGLRWIYILEPNFKLLFVAADVKTV